ncbi:MAG TPA: chromosomal replication initiator protein DnaA, partial [Kiloniellales bacterium]|nr:chromosomal replication initiator protein DnaA [Kiloniellales bacterium]
MRQLASEAVVDPLSEQWARIRGRLRAEVGDAAFRSWLKPLTLVSIKDGVARMSVPTRFMRDWVVGNYAECLKSLWQDEDDEIQRVEIVVQPPARPSPKPELASETTAQEIQPARAARVSTARESDSAYKDLTASLDPRFTFEDFVVGKPNELAYAAARRVAEARSVPFNPLFLYGPVGLGKTHLMHAIAWQIKKLYPQRRIIYLSAEKFMYAFVRALRTKDTVSFKDQFRSVDVLMIDDVQFIGGREATQEEFFHTFNALVDQNRQVVISADKSPSDLEGVEERMRSRLGWGLVADIHPTTYELR